MADNFGDLDWIYTIFNDHVGETELVKNFMAIFPIAEERFKQKKPQEVGGTIMANLKSKLSAAAADYLSVGQAPTALLDLTDRTIYNHAFPKYMVGWGIPYFYMNVARHILGEELVTFRDNLPAFTRQYYETVVAPVFARTINLTGKTPTEVLYARRQTDITIAFIKKSMDMADEYAQRFLTRVGYSGDQMIGASLYNTGFELTIKEWYAECIAFAGQIYKPGALIALIADCDKLFDRMTIYRRRTETQPRLSVTFDEVEGLPVQTWKYRDRGTYLPVRDFIAAGYKNMAYKIDGIKLSPIMESDDINELMLDLTIPVPETSSERSIAVNAAAKVVASNTQVRWRTDHVTRYLTDEGFGAKTEYAAFAIDYPKGSHKQIYNLNSNRVAPAGTTIADFTSIVSNPEMYQRAEMVLFGDTYLVEGAGAVDYALFFAEQALGCVTPFDTDTGKITVTMGSWLQGPSSCNDIKDMIYVTAKAANEQPLIYANKVVIKRFATAHLGISESVFDDSEWTILGNDLLQYYLRMLKLIGFEDIATAIATSIGHTRTEFAAGHGSASMYMTWGNQSLYNNRFKALNIGANESLRYKLAMLQIFMSKISNEQVLKAVMQSMSIYLTWLHPTLSSKTIEEVWRGDVVGSLF